MSAHAERGATLIVGLMLLALVTLLGLAGATTAHIEAQLAHNEQFRENAASAASAGVEYAISQIVNSSDASSSSFSATVPGSLDHFESETRFLGYDLALPQASPENLAGAHFEIISTGYSSRRAVDRQRALVMRVDAAADEAPAAECAPAALGVHCHLRGELIRLSWQRLALP
jgi:Tfp pilus assembly protein PilX